MANNIKLFNTVADYEAAELVYPSVSYIVETDRVAYDDNGPTPIPSFKWKATYSDGNVISAECDSSSAITDGEIEKTNLVSVEIGDCVTTIGNQAFDFCTSLTSVTIPDSVTSIGEQAFFYCTSLSSVTIPSSVTSIGDYAFNSCSAWVGDISLDSIVSIGGRAFENCSGLTSVIIGSGCTSIGDSAFEMNGKYLIPYLACLPTTPPALSLFSFGIPSGLEAPTVYVPAESVDAYKAVLNNGTFPTASVKPLP